MASPLAGTQPVARDDGDLPEWEDPRRFLDLDSLRWAEWETRPADPAARLRELGITPIRRDSADLVDYGVEEQGYDPNGERVEDFHFADFSGDGVADVIYVGGWFARNEDGEFGAAEGTRLRVYQVIGGRAVPVLEHHGAVQRVWKGRPGEPVSFRAVHYGCCSDPTWASSSFAPCAAATRCATSRTTG